VHPSFVGRAGVEFLLTIKKFDLFAAFRVLTTVLLQLILLWSSVTAQEVANPNEFRIKSASSNTKETAEPMPHFVTNKNEITVLSIDSISGDSYIWELYNDSTVNFAVDPGVTGSAAFAEFVGSNIGASVSVRWKARLT